MPISEAEAKAKIATTKPTKHDIEAVHFNVGLGVDWIGEASELRDSTEVGDKVLLHVSGGSPSDVQVVLKLSSATVLRGEDHRTRINSFISRLLRELSEG